MEHEHARLQILLDAGLAIDADDVIDVATGCTLRSCESPAVAMHEALGLALDRAVAREVHG